MTYRPMWELVEEAAKSFSTRGDGVFRLAEIIDFVQTVDPSRQRSSIQPVVQGMTMNAGTGPPSPCGRILRRVDHGLYVLASNQQDQGAASPPTPPRQRRTAASLALTPRLAELETDFDDLVDAYDNATPFRRAGQLEFHQSTIRMRRNLGSVRAAVESERFADELHRTLYAWGIVKRASRLVSVERLRQTLRDRLPELEELDGVILEESNERDTEALVAPVFNLIMTLDIVDNEARIVAGTKALHHLLPDLVPPMDRAWTGAFFNWSPAELQFRQRQTFTRTFTALADVARGAKPSRLVGGGWRTSSTKVLDNAVVGFCIKNKLGVARNAPTLPS